VRALLTVVADAEAALTDADQERYEPLLREILQWVGFRPSPAERERIAQIPGADPSRYLVMPVMVQINPNAPGGIAPTPQGDVAFFNLQLVLPMANLNATKVLGADGQLQNPAEGMHPLLEARWLLPRGRVASHVLQNLGLVSPVQLVRE
jgi:hypothetical protein